MWCEQRNEKFRYFERYSDPMTGKLKRVSVTLDRKSDKKAFQMLSDLIAERTRCGDYTLREAADAYLQDQLASVRKQTYIRNKRSIDHSVSILGPDNIMDKLAAAYIRRAYQSSDKSDRTENENMSRFKTFIRWAYRHDYICSTACIDKLEPFRDSSVKERIKDKYLNRDELATLLAEIKDEGNRLVIEFLALSGLRIGELIALDDSDVTDVIRVTKTFSVTVQELSPGKTFASRREVHIQPELADCVNRLRAFMRRRKLLVGVPRCPYFVISRSGKRLQYCAFNQFLKENTKKIIGRALTVHSLRHTHASLLAEAGYPLEAISRRLGHESSAITKEVYLHITEGIKKKDAELLDAISLVPPICPQRSREAL